MKSVTTAMLAFLLLAASAAAQGPPSATVEMTRTPDAAPLKGLPTGQEAAGLREQLRRGIDIPLQIIASDGSPVTIQKATVRMTRRTLSAPAGGSEAPPINDYAMSLHLSLRNDTTEQISVIGLEFSGAGGRNAFGINQTRLALEPHKLLKIDIDLMTVSGDPGQLAVRVVNVEFATQAGWKNPERLSVHLPASPKPSYSDVDVRPRTITFGSPRYTETARSHKVVGTVTLDLEVGADGAVHDVKVVSALPDGLSDEAIRVTRELKLSPALKNNQPVSCWVRTVVDFNLR